MTFEAENLPIWTDRINNNKNKFCIHCSILLPQSHNNNYENNSQNFNLDSIFMEASEMSPSSITTISSEWLRKALFSIFKINYLNAFDTVKEDQIEEDVLALCENCNQIMSNLHQLYNDFLELGKINSYLHKKLQRLDEIIDSHQQKTIKCDLINTPFFQIEEDESNSCNFLNDNEDESNNISSVTKRPKKKNMNSSKATTTTTSLLLNNNREPRILLTRLPGKYTRRQQAEKVKDDNIVKDQFSDCNSPANSNNDDDDSNNYQELLPKVKIEETEDYSNVAIDEDDGYLQPSSLSEASNSSEDYHPKSIQKNRKKKKESRRRKEETTQKRRTRGRPAKIVNNSSNKLQPQLVDGGTKRKRSDNKSVQSSSKSNKKSIKKGTAKSPVVQLIKKAGINYNIKTGKYLAKKAKYANPCWYCKKFFPTPADCFEHTKQEHLPENCDLSTSSIVICDRCSRICFTDREFQIHVPKCELVPPGELVPKMYSCPQCSKCFAEKCVLQGHIQSHSSDRPFPCDECSYRAKHLLLLKRHKFSVHTIRTQLFKCDECDSVLKNEVLLRGHKFRMHTSEGQVQYSRNQAISKVKKMEVRRLKRLATSTICADCNVDLFSRLAFINHRRTFHGERVGDFVCEVCGQEFTTKYALKDHTKFVHTDARPFLCTQCGKSFKQMYHLRKHDKATHTEEGRLEYNRQIRECNRRRKIRQSHLSQVGEQLKQQQQQQQQQRQEISNSSMDSSSMPQDWTNNQRNNAGEGHSHFLSSL